ncbi:hypothetical protein DRN58_04160 [Thermococci archaeon]|nr:MAG: hypothetical protein DRN50_05730 [Thermococci archaeon]RLG00014.1 MAG: hypothetical protein DRN58_04160 [Thermococci archaeon]
MKKKLFALGGILILMSLSIVAGTGTRGVWIEDIDNDYGHYSHSYAYAGAYWNGSVYYGYSHDHDWDIYTSSYRYNRYYKNKHSSDKVSTRAWVIFYNTPYGTIIDSSAYALLN